VSAIEVYPVKMGIAYAYLVRQDGTILIDTGYPGSEEAILAAAKEQGIEPGDIRLILLTHGHGDHAGSAQRIREITGAKVAVHRDDAEKLRNGHQGLLHPTCLSGRLMRVLLGGEKKARFPPVEPDILISERFDLREFGIDGAVIPTPGHTPGSVSVRLASGDAIVGDAIFPSIPFEKPGLPFFADDINETKKSIGIILAWRPARIHTGHGGPFLPDDLTPYQ
jgi:hydroxyacylglutathione hydrolase